MTNWQWAGVCLFILLSIYAAYLAVRIARELKENLDAVYDEREENV